MFTVAYENDDNVDSDGSNVSDTGNNSEDEEQISYDDLVNVRISLWQHKNKRNLYKIKFGKFNIDSVHRAD